MFKADNDFAGKDSSRFSFQEVLFLFTYFLDVS